MVALACKVSVRFLQYRPDVTLPESLIGEETALMRRAAGFLRTGWALLAIFTALTVYAGVRLVDAVHLGDATAITAHRGSSIDRTGEHHGRHFAGDRRRGRICRD